ncbi:MAG: hypothetical protein AAF687_04215 [Pseudomonadota bacterium]
MKDWLAQRWTAWLGLALVVDLWMILGPSIFTGRPQDMWLLPLRWLNMVLGLASVDFLDPRSPTRTPLRRAAVIYFILGFTVAGCINAVIHQSPAQELQKL